MMKMKWTIAGLVVLCGMAQAGFVTIGNAGNAADTADGDIDTAGIQRYGAVGYTYQISATEVTIAEFQASGAGNGNENFWNNGTYTVGTAAPATGVSLYEAMKYCNWLTSGNINSGLYEDKGGGVWGAKFNRATVMAGSVNYFALPTEDEWYKAAYYTGNSGDLWSLYANGTDTVPTKGGAGGWNYEYALPAPNRIWTTGFGGEEQNGTYNMMGNVREWVEASGSVTRGGGYGLIEAGLRSSARGVVFSPELEGTDLGLRVVAIPEPASAMLVFFGAGVAVVINRARCTAMRR